MTILPTAPTPRRNHVPFCPDDGVVGGGQRGLPDPPVDTAVISVLISPGLVQR
jgi:hypothetical protein